MQYDQMPGVAGKRPIAQTGPQPVKIFVFTGCVMLFLLTIVPIWNAVALLSDVNYTFWVGKTLPLALIGSCVAIFVIYIVTIMVFFGRARPQAQMEPTIFMIASLFVTVLGVMLMLISLPLSRQTTETYNNLMHRCDFSVQTHRLYEYSQVLQNIRSLPDCKNQMTVEMCLGYEPAEPYTSFLKAMETDLKCSGFCYRQPAFLQTGYMNHVPPPNRTAIEAEENATSGNATAAQKNATRAAVPGVPPGYENLPAAPWIPAPIVLPGDTADGTGAAPEAAASFLFQVNRHGHSNGVSLLSVDDSLEHRTYQPAPAAFVNIYPPTLFSTLDHQASCEGMSARDMKNFAGDISFQTFYQGIYLVMISIATGLLKLIGFCVVRKDSEL